MFHSTSPAAKRSLKPSPIAATTQQSTPFAASADLPPLQPAAAPAQESFTAFTQPSTAGNAKKRKSVSQTHDHMANTATPAGAPSNEAPTAQGVEVDPPAQEPKAKKSRTNTPWTPAEELRLKNMRDAGNSWSEIAKVWKKTDTNPSIAHVDTQHA